MSPQQQLLPKIEVGEAKNRMLTDAVCGMNDKMNTLTEKIEAPEVNQAKRMVVLAGFDAHQKKYIARKQLYDFMTDQVQIDVEIEEFYYIGKATPKDIVITLASANQKRCIFQNLDKHQTSTQWHGEEVHIQRFLDTSTDQLQQKKPTDCKYRSD